MITATTGAQPWSPFLIERFFATVFLRTFYERSTRPISAYLLREECQRLFGRRYISPEAIAQAGADLGLKIAPAKNSDWAVFVKRKRVPAISKPTPSEVP